MAHNKRHTRPEDRGQGLYTQARDKATEMYEGTGNFIGQHPATSTMFMFGLGFGIGLALTTMMETQRKSWFESHMPSKFNGMSRRQFRNAISHMLPDMWSKHFA
jgi:hypothetical protein